MLPVATEHLKLRKCPDGYYRTSWVDDSGRRHGRSFGKHRTRAYNAFGRFRTEWKTDPAVRNPSGDGPLTIQAAWERFDAHAEAYYRRPDGTPTGEAQNITDAMQPVLELYGELSAAEFGPKSLKRAREEMVSSDLCINTINARVRRIRQVWKWLASEELIPPATWHGLQTVEALREGRTDARSTTPVGPVPDEYIWRVVAKVPRTVQAMIELQYYTGMRPGEVCTIRPIDIEMSGKVWTYRPHQHKSRHVGRDRLVLIGPKAQAVIKPFLRRDVNACLFSPREAMRQRYDARSTHRRQPVEAPKTDRKVGDSYSVKAYQRCIWKVCEDNDIPHWSPNQLRHNAGTRLRKEFGLDVAQAVLGHSRADVTQLYAALDLAKARDVMEKIG